MPDAIQAALSRSMKSRQGCVVVLDGSGRQIAAWRPDLAKTLAAPPGSAVKPFTLRALLPVRPAPVICQGGAQVEGRELPCSHARTAAAMDASEALALSCNSWFAHNAMLLRPEQLAQALRWAGAELSSVNAPRELRLQALGIAHVRFTPFALASGYRRLANENNASIREGLERAVREGTASAAARGGLSVAGKTGTTKEGCWFAGWSPASTARVVVAVYLQSGRGASDAAPIAGEVFAAWRDSRRP